MESLTKTQVWIAIGLCVLFWPLPIISGLACNIVELRMVSSLLEERGIDNSYASKVFWAFRMKHIFLFIATYLPWVGIPFQVVDVYLMAEFCGNYKPSGGKAIASETLSPDEFRSKIATLKPYYKDEFTKIYNSNGSYKGKWNWSACLFNWIWALTKGLTMQGLVSLVCACFLVCFGGIVISIYFGIYGNKLYYEKMINGINAWK